MPATRLAIACAAILFLSAPSADVALARPQYLKEFARRYKHIEFAAKDHKCAVCHCGSSKKGFNNYGAALKDEFAPAKNIKVPGQIDSGLWKNESKPSHVPGKTFGELIQEGLLPGAPCPETPAKQRHRPAATYR